MANNIYYVVLSARVYRDIRYDKNTNPVPNGWSEIFYGESDSPLSGLTAGAYLNDSETEIVIAFKGMDVTSISDFYNDIALFTGFISPQLIDAVSLYLNIKNDPLYQDIPISFTGHSLGGGIASIMGVWFDKKAVVFDEAPAQLAAFDPIPGVRAIAEFDADFMNYLASAGTAFFQRELFNVTGYYIEGEILSYFRSYTSAIVSPLMEYSIRPDGTAQISPEDTHLID